MVSAQTAPNSEALVQVQAELAELQAKSSDLADQYLRAKADAENNVILAKIKILFIINSISCLSEYCSTAL